MAQDRLRQSLSEPKKRVAAEISSHEGNAPEKNLNPKREENPGRSGIKAGITNPGISHPSVIKGIRLAILSKMFPEQTLTREEQETIEDVVVRQMCRGWTAKLVFTGIRFRPGHILEDSVTEALQSGLGPYFLNCQAGKEQNYQHALGMIYQEHT